MARIEQHVGAVGPTFPDFDFDDRPCFRSVGRNGNRAFISFQHIELNPCIGRQNGAARPRQLRNELNDGLLQLLRLDRVNARSLLKSAKCQAL